MSSKKLFLLFLLILAMAAGRASAQDVPRIDQDFVQWTQAAVDGNHRPGSNGYQHPNPLLQEDSNFQAAVEAFLDEDWALADELAGEVRYEVIAFRDTGSGEVFYGLIPQADNGDGRGFYFVRPRADVQRRLVIQAPHAVEDERTGVLGSEMFRASGARALMLTGADRCASNTASTCSGSTDCGPHTVADGAHAVGSFFYIFNQLAGREHADTYVLQLHGFKVDPGEPEFSVSDGTETNQASTYITNLFHLNLENRMKAVVTTLPRNGNSCNGGTGHTDFQCGTFSVQGRDLNGSVNACQNNAQTATGRFIHLEMSNDLRDPSGIYSQQLVIDTVNAIFPRTAEAGGLLWADLDNDGIQDAGERGIHGVTVEVIDSNGNVIESGSARVGQYRIGNLDAGTYRVRVQLPSGYSYGSGLDSNGRTSAFTLTAGQSLTAVDAALVPSAVGQVGDRVWRDADEDGLDGSENGVAGISVQLLAGDSVVDTTSTDAQGFYEIANVPPGDYKLKVASGADGFTTQGIGVTDGDSEVSPATGTSPVFQLASGVTDDTRDAGLVGPCYDVDLVAGNSAWKFWTPGASDTVPSNWNQAAFTGDGTWQEGFSPLGYATSQAFTDTGDPDAVNGRFATYFRLSFEGADALAFQEGLQLTLKRRGGVIVYLNGTEILRRNLPWGAAVGAGTPASTESNTTTETLSIPAGLLLSGSNLLAVELHQYQDDDDPTDLSPGLFNLELTGQVCGSCRVKERFLTTTNATTIKAGSPGSNFGGNSTLQLDGMSDGTIGSSTNSVLVAWDLSSIPQGADVLHAEVVVRVSNDSDEPYSIHELLRSWNESGTTGASWDHAIRTSAPWQLPGGATDDDDSSPARLGLMPLDSGTSVSAAAPLNPAGRSVVEKWIDNPATNFGFLIEAEPNTDDGLDFNSDDNSNGNAPQLRVIYLDPTCQP